jgi:hypothetical protein
MTALPRLAAGYTQGPDFTLADLRPGDSITTRPSARRPYAMSFRLVKVNRKTFGWEDGQECGPPGKERLWVRRDDRQQLQGAVVARGKALHVVIDPGLEPFKTPDAQIEAARAALRLGYFG